MPPVTAYAVPQEISSPKFCRAFALGAAGVYAEDGQLRPGDVALFGSPALWDLLLQAREEGRTWYYGDKGYFGRNDHFRVTRDAFQAGPELVAPQDAVDRARAEAILRRYAPPETPWRRQGRHVLVCPPGPVYANLMRRAGYPMGTPEEWVSGVTAELRRWTDRASRVRTKDAFRAGRPLAEDLDGAWAVVTFASNVAVEAAMMGVPVFVLGPGAGRAFGLTDLSRIESPAYPEDRREKALALAASQWTTEEISEGRAWRSLCRC